MVVHVVACLQSREKTEEKKYTQANWNGISCINEWKEIYLRAVNIHDTLVESGEAGYDVIFVDPPPGIRAFTLHRKLLALLMATDEWTI